MAGGGTRGRWRGATGTESGPRAEGGTLEAAGRGQGSLARAGSCPLSSADLGRAWGLCWGRERGRLSGRGACSAPVSPEMDVPWPAGLPVSAGGRRNWCSRSASGWRRR